MSLTAWNLFSLYLQLYKLHLLNAFPLFWFLNIEETIIVQGDITEPTAEELEIYDISVEEIVTHNTDGTKSITKLKKKRLKKIKPKRKRIRAAINTVGNERARELLVSI